MWYLSIQALTFVKTVLRLLCHAVSGTLCTAAFKVRRLVAMFREDICVPFVSCMSLNVLQK